MSETLKHGMNCPYWTEQEEADCTCGLRERIKTQTAETLLAAWQKRAGEAEIEIVKLRAEIESQAETIHNLSEKRHGFAQPEDF